MTPPRGIAVVDVGATNTKIVLFSAEGSPVAERKRASRHVEGPPYRHIDPQPMVELVAEALPELDKLVPIDVIVPCAHGAALACLAADGSLALPVVDYTDEPPAGIVADYRKIMPPFAETYCPLLPMALTHGLQLYWQEQAFPEAFAGIATVIPWIQYVGFRLCGRAVTEITSMSCQTHLVDVAHGGPSSLVKRRGWTKLFPPLARAWDTIGSLKSEFRGVSFRGEARVLAGIHDSSANYLRYLAAGRDHFTLLSTGTWVISFDTDTPVDALREDYDTSTNTNIFGKTVATSRFFGGKEFEILAGEAAAAEPTLAAAADLAVRGVLALPSFTGSPGPMPGTGNRGRILGELPAGDTPRVSLASLYCALMVAEQLDLLGSRHEVIADGPFARNPVFLALLAQLRPGQKVLASDLRDGTTAGAACLALMQNDRLPHIGLSLNQVAPASIPGLAGYQSRWRQWRC
ncbi:MAG: L-fuculose kinase [Rhizobiales bacterium]|nr:L-fuculose kinase [Hyphomicrobiales bacterium]